MMKRITLFFLVLFSQTIFAQFTANDVKFFVGEGTQTAYLVVDFKDGTDERSYAWGYRFNSGANVTMGNILVAIANAEPNFSVDPVSGTGFLNDVIYNSHSGLAGDPDWWSTWSGSSPETFSQNMGISTVVENGFWYGLSYGFGNPQAEAPVQPIPAYSSQWFQTSQITNWIGTGTNQSLVVVDFGTQTNGSENSYVFGIKYNGTISAEEALELIQTETTYFNFTSVNNQIETLNLGLNSGVASASNPWKIYEGTNLSDWQTKANLSQVNLTNNHWLGLSFSARRPFTPQEASETLSNQNEQKFEFKIYPNPTTDYLNILVEDEITVVTVFNMQGKEILKTNSNKVDVSNLTSGVYMIEVITNSGKAISKFIKK